MGEYVFVIDSRIFLGQLFKIMTNNTQNPVTGNGAGADSKNQVKFTKVVSASSPCEDSYYGYNPPDYREVKCRNEQSLLAALRRVLNVADRSGDEALDVFNAIKNENLDIWRNFEGHYGTNCSIRMHDAVKVNGKLYVNV